MLLLLWAYNHGQLFDYLKYTPEYIVHREAKGENLGIISILFLFLLRSQLVVIGSKFQADRRWSMHFVTMLF